jgi:dTMP kinase
MRGRFITFEGLDGSGKSTHLKRAATWLEARGVATCVTHEPGGTDLGESIRGLFLDHRWRQMDGRVEALLVFASRRQHLLEVIEPALRMGTTVLCDRFTDSTRAYQGHGRGLSLELIDRLDMLATGGRQPDLTLLFDLPAEAARARCHSPSRIACNAVDRLDAEDLAFYQRVRDGYRAVAEAAPERLRMLDSNGDKDATWRQVETVLEGWVSDQPVLIGLASSGLEEEGDGPR